MNQSYLKLILIVIVIIGVISGAVIYNQQITEHEKQQNQNSVNSNSLEVGASAPDFSLTNLAGENISLSDFRGKYVLVNFWATWCPPCRAEMPDLNQFHQENKEDFVVIGVNIGDSRTKVKEFITNNGYDYPILLDQTKEVSTIYHISAIPTSYFIGPTGRIQYIKRGLISKSELDQIKAELINEKS